ncbi:hypothetical protein HYT84_03245, partial [Candidatus Micrarchaeota archaeon]|nr:hypothetical protein [Candidatus Micrarchaeota archaeon]
MRFSRLIRIGLVVTVLSSSFNPAYSDDKRRAAEAFKRVERVLIDEGVSLGRYREEEPPQFDEKKRQETIKWAEDAIKRLATLSADKEEELLKSGLNKTWGEGYTPTRQRITEDGINATDQKIKDAFAKFKEQENYIGLTLVYLLVSARDKDNYEAVGKKLEEIRVILNNVIAEFIPPSKVERPKEEVTKVVPTKINRKWLLEDLERLGGSENLYGKRMEQTKSVLVEY